MYHLVVGGGWEVYSISITIEPHLLGGGGCEGSSPYLSLSPELCSQKNLCITYRGGVCCGDLHHISVSISVVFTNIHINFGGLCHLHLLNCIHKYTHHLWVCEGILHLLNYFLSYIYTSPLGVLVVGRIYPISFSVYF